MGHLDARILGVARRTVEHYVLTGEMPSLPADLPPELGVPRAVFVTLRTGNTLRGCIGTLVATKPTLGEEIASNAVAAACADPRFPLVTPNELPLLSYEVHIVGPLTSVAGKEELHPERYGVVVESGRRRGVLLPAIEGVTSTDQQIAIARQKAGIAPDEPVTLYRFSVLRYREDA